VEASAALDGEEIAAATAGERAAELERRRDELARARDAIATPVEPPSPEVRDRQIAAALAARADDATDADAAPRAASGAVVLAHRRPHRRTVAVRVLAGAGAAAAVVLVVVLVYRARSSSSGPELTRGASSAVSAAAGSTQGTDLGTFSSVDALVRGASTAARAPNESAALAAPSTTAVAPKAGGGGPNAPAGTEAAPSTTTAPAPGDPCDAVVRSTRPGLGDLVLVGHARLDGKPVQVLAYRAGTGPVRVIVLSPRACVVLVDRSS
jgi:hypothetical protein